METEVQPMHPAASGDLAALEAREAAMDADQGPSPEAAPEALVSANLPPQARLWWFARVTMALRWGLAAAALALIPLGAVGPWECLWLVTGYLLTCVGLTAGHHRLFSHRSYVAKPGLRLALAILGTMAWQGSPLFWAGIHRRHHRHADRPGDPHSPHVPEATPGPGKAWRAFAQAQWLWTISGKPEPWVRFVPDLLAEPMLRRVHQLNLPIVLVGLLIPTALGAWVHGTWMGALAGGLWGGGLRVWLLEQTVFMVSSVCHLWGDRAFEVQDRSVNVAWLSALLMGEGWHNNHHAFPASARHGLLQGQWDPNHGLIRAWQRLGWASEAIAVGPERLAAKVRPEWAHRLPRA
jgi:stearoyl-CoA desaturase (delta-9 desaturase)